MTRDHRVALEPLAPEDRERFIADNQEAFNYGALEEFGRRDDHSEEDGQIIARETIERSIDEGEALRIVCDGRPVGGAVVRIDGDRGAGRTSGCCVRNNAQFRSELAESETSRSKLYVNCRVRPWTHARYIPKAKPVMAIEPRLHTLLKTHGFSPGAAPRQ